MNPKNVTTPSTKVAAEKRYTILLLLIVLILAGISAVGLLANKPAPISTVAQPSTTHLPGHDFGAIYGDVDPGSNRSGSQAPFVYWVGGQMVVRQSEMGPLTGYTDNSLVAGNAAGGSGMNVSASYSEQNGCNPQPPITYTIAGVTITRRSELGPLADTRCNSIKASQSAGGSSTLESASYPVVNACTPMAPITYTVAGQTITRHSELGPLADSTCMALLANVP